MQSTIGKIVPAKISGGTAVRIAEWYQASFHFMLYDYSERVDRKIWGDSESPPAYHKTEKEFSKGTADVLREIVGGRISSEIDSIHTQFFEGKPRGNLCAYYGCSLFVEFMAFMAKLPTDYSSYNVRDAITYKEMARKKVTDDEAKNIDDRHRGFYNMLWSRLTPTDSEGD